jgi:hypothetical protein
VAYEGWHGLQRGGTSTLQWVRSSEPSLVLPPCPEVSQMTLGHTLWTVAPVLFGGWALLGEPEKIVKVSSRRFSGIVSTTTAFSTRLRLAPGESVEVAVAAAAVSNPRQLDGGVGGVGGGGRTGVRDSVGAGAGEVIWATCHDAAARKTKASRTTFGDIDVSMTLSCARPPGQPVVCSCD